jgi:DNA-binding transcriptional ArsR family regulator
MAYKFAPEQSKIVDFLNFPNYAFVSESEQDVFKDNYYEYIPKETIQLFKEIEKILLPYKKEILEFYLFKSYSFSTILLKALKVFEYSSINDFLAGIKKLDTGQLKYHVIRTLMEVESEGNHDETIDLEIKEIMKENKYMSFVENTSIEGSSKWHIMQWLTMTEEKVVKYLELMAKLRPIFDSYSKKYETEVQECGHKLIDLLNNGKTFYEITNGLVRESLYPEGIILISWVQPMEIAIVLSQEVNYLRFGLKIEDFLENMKILDENYMLERVTALKNLGDKTRYSVMKCVASGMHSTKKIAESLGVSSATISYHLNNLLSCRLISYESIDGKLKAVVNKEWLEELLEEVKKDFIES